MALSRRAIACEMRRDFAVRRGRATTWHRRGDAHGREDFSACRAVRAVFVQGGYAGACVPIARFSGLLNSHIITPALRPSTISTRKKPSLLIEV